MGFRAGKILVRTLNNEIKPVMAFNKLRLLKGGGMTIDFLAPMRSVFKRMKKTELPSSAWSPAACTELGLSLWKAEIVVVKNLFPFRYRFLLYNRKTVNVMTSGTTDIDVFSLKYTTIPRPIYPLDEIDTWR